MHPEPLFSWKMLPPLHSLFAVSLLVTLASACAARNPATSPASAATAPAENRKSVIVTPKREGEVTRFFVENKELCEVTMTFDVHLGNLKSSQPLPYTASFPPQQVTEAFSVSPADPSEKWEYSYTNHFKLGSVSARHDNSCVYHLPYLPGNRFLVTQGFNGSYSHKGANQYAVDWKMPEGTVICAARGGVVVKTKGDSNTGGSSMKYDKFNNFVLIRHDDGTLAHYCHLKQRGIKVSAGQRVEAGQPIALSGNTGFSSGPHLHFCVFKARNGRERESIPIRFRTSDETAVTLVESRRYEPARVAVGGGENLVSKPEPSTRSGG
jgi:murein DD-endopeptidase MepM/ murein hydrolase activator NlpD